MSSANGSRTSVLALVVLAMAAAIALPALKREQGPATAACPPEFAQTRMAATLLWSTPDVGFAERPSTPVDGHHPDDLRLLETGSDGEACARIAAVIPDSLKPLGLLAPRFAAYYEVGDLYVVPVVPHVSPQEIDAEVRGERYLDEVGVTFVYDRDLQLVAAVEN